MFKIGIIGGGFFGVSLAAFLSKYDLHVTLYEREESLFKRSSSNNQARVHTGLHYLRDYKTALRSQNLNRTFVKDYKQAIFDEFTHWYGVSSIDSNVDVQDVDNFISLMNISAEKEIPNFENSFITQWYKTYEPVFNSKILLELMLKKIKNCEVKLDIQINNVSDFKNKVVLTSENSDGKTQEFDFVFNCTYGNFDSEHLALEYVLSEIALVKPGDLSGIGLTVIDGSFFSFLPFPSKRDLYSFSHVRYTHHNKSSSPIMLKDSGKFHSNIDFMLRDASRFVPSIENLEYVESIFETKTLMLSSSIIDSRPVGIFVDDRFLNGNYVHIIGSKIDNVYDCLDFVYNRILPHICVKN